MKKSDFENETNKSDVQDVIVANHNTNLEAVFYSKDDPLRFEPIIAWKVYTDNLCSKPVCIESCEDAYAALFDRSTGNWWIPGLEYGKGEELLLKALREL